jgi:hypothetical protein
METFGASSAARTRQDDQPARAVFESDDESIEELEAKLESLKASSSAENEYSLQRRLILRMCHDWKNYSKSRLEKIEKLAGELPRAEFTPLLCQDLMYFYVKVHDQIACRVLPSPIIKFLLLV